jgi:hypothetical protein
MQHPAIVFALSRLTALPQRLRMAVTPRRQAALWLVLFFLLGIELRWMQYWPARSLWHDEAALAVNIVHRSFAGLLEPLDFNQGAPAGFLLIQKALTVTFGSGVRVLRFLPFLCSILSLPLFYRLARRLLEPQAALIALGLFALARPLSFYAGELKQYSSDVLIALLLLDLALTVHERTKRGEPAPWRLWGVIGALSLWFAHIAIFILAGTGICCAIACWQRGDRSGLRNFAGALGLWLFSFGTCYFCLLRNLDHNEYLLTFWKTEFMPLPPRSAADLEWLPRALFGFLNSPVGLSAHDISLAGIGALAFVAGCIALFAEKRVELAMVLTPLPFTLLASGLHKYPFGDRMVLFLVPAVLLVIASGTEFILRRTSQSARFVGVTVLVLVFLAPVIGSVGKLIEPGKTEQIEPLLTYLQEHRQEGDPVYVFTSAWPAYLYHVPAHGLPTDAPVIRGSSGGDWANYLNDLDGLRGKPRVWLVLVHHARVEQLFRCELARRGKKLDTLETPGATLYLYDFSAPPAE